MTRRQALIAALSLPLADVRVLARETKAGAPAPFARGHLTVPLDSWGSVAFTHKGQTVSFSTAEIFAVLKEEK